MRITDAAVLVAFGLLAAPGGAFDPSAVPQQPSFRVSTDVVAIDVTALNASGTPVKDLTIADFVVRVDGQARQIRSAQYIDQAPRVRDPGADPLFSSNQSGAPGRLVLLVVDERTIEVGGMRATAESAGALFAGLGASDKVGLALLPGPRMPVTFADDRQRVLSTLKRVVGSYTPRESVSLLRIGVTEASRIERGDPFALNEAVNRECVSQLMERNSDERAKQQEVAMCEARVRHEASQIVVMARQDASRLVSDLRAILKRIAPIAAPKILIVFSQGIPSPDAATEMAILGPDAAAARATIHAVRLDRALFDIDAQQPAGSMYEDREANRRGLEALAGRARGTVIDVTGGTRVPFERLAAEMSGYYLLGMETIAADRDGKRHRIAVEVPRRGVTVRARPDFVFEAPVPLAPPRDETALLMDTLGAPFITSDVPIRVTTFNMADDDRSRVRLLLSAEIDRQQERPGTASVGYLVYDQSGNVVVNYSRRLDLARAPSGALRFHSVTSIPAGSYTLRFAAVRNERAGSVEHRFTAALSRVGSLVLGDLVLNDGREPAALVPPVDGRFETETVRGFVQIAAGAPRDASFTLELAKNDSGPVLVRTSLSRGLARDGVQAVSGLADVRLLPPGDYRARLSISVAGKTASTLSAPLSLVAPPRPAPAANPGPAGLASSTVLHAVADVAPFNAAEVLAPDVVGPFLEEVAARSPDLPKAAIDAAKAGRFDEALAQMKTGPADAAAPFVRGAALLAKGNAQGASDAFRDTIRAAPDSMVGVFYVGACYAAGGRHDRAAAAWQTSLAGLDRYPVVYRVLADAFERTGQVDRAVAVLDEASTRWPDDEVLARRLASAELAVGLHEQALAHVEGMIAKQPGDASLLFLALQSLYHMGLAAPDNGLPALVERMEHYGDLYAAANGPRQALVAEWISYFSRRAS